MRVSIVESTRREGSDARAGVWAAGTVVASKSRMQLRRILVLGSLAATALACATPCKNAETRSELRDFELDHERCEDRARKLAGNIDVGDYKSCMRVRGWCRAPEDASPLL